MADIMKILKKDISSVALIFIALISLLAFTLMIISVQYSVSTLALIGQVAFLNTAIICLIFGLSTWLFSSSSGSVRATVGKLQVLVLLLVMLEVLITSVFLLIEFTVVDDKVLGNDVDNWYSSTLTMVFVSAVLGILIGIGLILLNVYPILAIIWPKGADQVQRLSQAF